LVIYKKNLKCNLVGPVASFYHCLKVDKLPKTRSGKTLRGIIEKKFIKNINLGTIKKLVDGKKLDKIPPTIDDASSL